MTSRKANEPPLDLRRFKLTLQYIVKLKANIDNPASDCVLNPQYENLYDKKNVLNQLALEFKRILMTLIYL